MYLDVHGSAVPIQVSNESSFESPHTGSSLRRLDIRAVVQGREANDVFVAWLDRARAGAFLPVTEDDGTVSQWMLRTNSWSHREGTRMYHHTLQIEEVEDLHLDHLRLGELDIQPYHYEEKFRQDSLTASAKVLLTERQTAELRSMIETGAYFPVVRYGISEEPLEMRFGMCYWSELEEGVKYDLYLVARAGEETTRPIPSAFAWARTLRTHVAQREAMIDALLDCLLDKAILTQEDVDQIHAEALERREAARHGLDKVDDIDDL